MASLDILGSGPPYRKYIKQYNLCAIKGTAIFKEQLLVAASMSDV